MLREADQRLRLSERLAACFTDHRRLDLIDHSVQELLAQRIVGLALGYEDLDDHDELSKDPLLATLVGKEDPARFPGKSYSSSLCRGFDHQFL